MSFCVKSLGQWVKEYGWCMDSGFGCRSLGRELAANSEGSWAMELRDGVGERCLGMDVGE